MRTFLLAVAAGLVASVSAADTCNGYTELCDRKYSNVSFVGSHDAAFVGYWVADNQFSSISDQLSAGFTFLTLETYDNSGTIDLCHTYCWLENAGTLLDTLSTIKDWISANPDIVVSLLLTNDDDLDVATYGDIFVAAGLSDLAYVPSGGSVSYDDWPTLGELIDNGTPLVVFMDYEADTSVVPYIMDEFEGYYFETPYDVTSTDDFEACAIDRPSGASPTGLMYIVNHFLDYSLLGLDVPDSFAASTTNLVDSIIGQADVCIGLYGRNPNVILLDFDSEGDGMGTFTKMNGLSY